MLSSTSKGVLPRRNRASSGDSVVLSNTRNGTPATFQLLMHLVTEYFQPKLTTCLVYMVEATLGLATCLLCMRAVLPCATALQTCSQCMKTAGISQQLLPSSCLFSEEKLGVKQLGKLAEKKTDIEITNVYVQSLWQMIGSIKSSDFLGCLIYIPTGLHNLKAWKNAQVFLLQVFFGFQKGQQTRF